MENQFHVFPTFIGRRELISIFVCIFLQMRVRYEIISNRLKEGKDEEEDPR